MDAKNGARNGLIVVVLFWTILFGPSCSGEAISTEQERECYGSNCDGQTTEPRDTRRDTTSVADENEPDVGADACVRVTWSNELTNSAWRLVPEIKNLSQPAEDLPQIESLNNAWKTNCATTSLLRYILNTIVPPEMRDGRLWIGTNFIAKRLFAEDGSTAAFYMFPATVSAGDSVFSVTAFYLVYRSTGAIWAEYHLKQGDVETYNFILPKTGDDRFDVVEPQIFFSEFNTRNPDLAGTSKSEPDKCGQFVEMCNFAAAIGSGLACSAASAKVTTWCVATVVGGSAGAATPAIPAVCGFLAALTEIWCSYTLSTAFSVIICNGWLRCYAPFMSDCECPLENPCASEIATCHEMCESAVSTPACFVFKEIVGGATHIRENHIADAFCDRLFAAASRDNCDTLCADECGDCIDACSTIPRHSTATCIPGEYLGYWTECVQLDGDVCNEAMFYRDMFCRGARLDYICYEGPCHPDGCSSTEICLNLIDDDCDGDADLADTDCLASCDDNDGDGYEGLTPTCPDGDDCNDFVTTVHPGAPEYCNGFDDDCDTTIDEGLACPSSDAGTDARDYTDTTDARDASDATDARDVVDTIDVRDVADTRDTCECTPSDTRTCTASCGTAGNQTCSPSCLWGTCQPPTEVCDGVDNDCDGSIDEGFECRRGQTGDPCTTSCRGANGVQTCSDSCRWTCPPPAEQCNRLDDDCDDSTDEDFACRRDDRRACTTSGGATGTQTCTLGCSWGTCEATAVELCDGADNDHDGLTDEDFTCVRGSTGPCVVCSHAGTKTCRSDCTWETTCHSAEICSNGCDDDSDGQTDRCDSDCGGPTTEDCTNGRDDDCDGRTDCDDSNCSSSSACLTCTDSDGDGYFRESSCPDDTDCDDSRSSVHPGATESCTNSRDDDCDGSTDCSDSNCSSHSACSSGCSGCTPGSSESCTTSCGTRGSRTCSSSCTWNPCRATEICNNCDDDANGRIDDNLSRDCPPPTGCSRAREPCVAGRWTGCVCID